MTCEPYTFAEHQHRLAAWAAGRAAFTRVDGGTVVRGRKYLEACSVTTKFGAEDLGNNREEFDEKHRKWREIILLEATRDGVKLAHGHAAKLLNVYFKIRFVCGPDHGNIRISFIHPPIDRLLLNALARKKVGTPASKWSTYLGWGWSKFDCCQYQQVIADIRQVQDLKGEPLWMIEKYWPGQQ